MSYVTELDQKVRLAGRETAACAMPVRLSGAPLIERYGAPTIAQPHGPLAVKDYNPTHGIKFAPRLSPGIMGSPPITMTSKEVRGPCSLLHAAVCIALHASLSPMCISFAVNSQETRQIPKWSDGGYEAGKNPAKSYVRKSTWNPEGQMW